MQNLLKAFFSKETIVNTLHILLTTNKSANTNPIMHFLLQLIQLPVCFALTDVGYAPFRNDTTIIIPFERMSAAQLLAVCEATNSMRGSREYVDTVQMGGGLYLREVQDSTQHFIDPSLVLFASNVLIRNSVPAHVNKRNISNVIIQRVLSSVNVSRDKIVEAEELSQQHSASLLPA